ncbi:MAG: glycosyltransferase family 4 protein [Bacteroidota bacterium]
MKKRILHLNTNLDVTSGVTRHIQLLTKNLSEDFEHHIIAFTKRTVNEYLYGDSTLICGIRTPKLINKLVVPFIIGGYVRKNKIGIIHSHHRYFDLAAAIISKFIHVRTITTVHSKVNGKKKISYRASTIVAVSKSINDHLLNYFGVERCRLKRINNFIDMDAIKCTQSKSAMRSQLGVMHDDILIGYVGRMDFREKGIDILIEAFKLLKKECSNIRLILVGGGKDLKTIMKMNSDEDLGILIKEPDENVFNIFQCIDLFVLPSRIDPFPYVMMEAAALNIPIVASRVDGIPEFIDDGVGGLLFEKNNVNDLVTKIESMLADKRLRRQFTERLHKKVFDRYGKEKILPEYVHLYNG